MKAKDNTSGTRHVAPLKRPPDPRQQFKPQVAQLKFGAAAAVASVSFGRERKSPPITPPAYRPHPVPKALQLKRHEVKKLGGIAQPQNAVRSPFIPQSPQKVLQKSANPSRPEVHRHQAATRNRAAQSPGHANPLCVQAKQSSSLRNNPLMWSARKPQAANVVRASRSIQLAAAEVEAKAEVKVPATLDGLAKKIHKAAGGSPDKNTTAVARLKSGQLVVCTQLPVGKVATQCKGVKGIIGIMKTKGSGYHCEVSLFIAYGTKIKAIGASQGFCPHCQEFLLAKGITMVGPPRAADDQVWYSPEYASGTEKIEGAKYPWAYKLVEPENTRVIFDTKADYAKWYKDRTGDDLPW